MKIRNKVKITDWWSCQLYIQQQSIAIDSLNVWGRCNSSTLYRKSFKQAITRKKNSQNSQNQDKDTAEKLVPAKLSPHSAATGARYTGIKQPTYQNEITNPCSIANPDNWSKAPDIGRFHLEPYWSPVLEAKRYHRINAPKVEEGHSAVTETVNSETVTCYIHTLYITSNTDCLQLVASTSSTRLQYAISKHRCYIALMVILVHTATINRWT